MNSLCKGFFFPKGISLLPKPDGFSSHLFCNNFCWAGWEEKQPPTSAPTTAWAVSAVTQLCTASTMRPCSRSLAWLTSLMCRSLFSALEGMGRSSSCSLLPTVAQEYSWGTVCGTRSRFPDPRRFLLTVGQKKPWALWRDVTVAAWTRSPSAPVNMCFWCSVMFLKTKHKQQSLFLLMLIACRKMRQLPSDWVTSASVLVPHSHVRPLCWASVEEVTSTCSTSESWGAVDAGLAMSAGDDPAPKRSPSLLGAFHL